MTQKIPKAMSILMTFIAKMVRGLNLFEAAVGVKINTEAAARADLANAETAQSDAQEAKIARKEATAARNAADEKVITLLTLTRELFKPKLGRRYSVAWKEIGFLNNTLGLPRSMYGRVGQLRAIQHHLETHPELEIPNVLTAAIAEEVYTLGVTTMSNVGIARATLRQKVTLRNAALAKLDKRARATFQELRMLMPANDARWLEFGFNIPDDKPIPAAPANLKVLPDLPGSACASWEAPVNSDRFRIYGKVVGRDEDFEAVESTQETAFRLTELPSGTRVQFYVTAVNKAGESVPSEIVEVVVA